MSETFYVGYLPRMEEPLRGFIRRVVWGLVVLVTVVPLALVAAQRGFSPGVFEYGTKREFEGFIEEFPAPALVVERPHVAKLPSDGLEEPYSRYLLVGFGKHGVAERVRGMAGRRVTIRGTLIARAGTTMIELADDGLRELTGDRVAPAFRSDELGRFELRGEIVDSKCWLGVMKPGEWKPHRACATRCIAGGVPPIFVVDREGGGSLQFLLVGANGEAVNAQILDRIAEPLLVEGRVVERGGTFVLYADPATYRRIE